MEEATSFEYFYLIFSSVISALIVTLTFHRLKISVPESSNGKDTTSSKRGNVASAFGIATGAFGAVCPACLGINFLLFGNIFTVQLSFLIPYIFWIQLGGIVLLLLGLYLVAKSSYEKKCISCSVEGVEDADKEKTGTNTNMPKAAFTKVIAIVAVVLLVFQVSNAVTGNAPSTTSKDNTLIADGKLIDVDAVVESVIPKDGFVTDVRWGDIVTKMIETGALDPQKLESILTKRYGQEMKQEWIAVLSGEDANLEINNDNAVFMMYLLWALAKHNDNSILHNSQFAQYFTNYDIGVGRAGYGDVVLLSLTVKQQALAKEIAENAYRPCCGQSTANPDCSHGFSALGLVELMTSQDFSKAEIYDAFVKFNSFWFPETYVKNALYFKIAEGQDWNETDKELISGIEYSSLAGSYKVKNYLQENFGI